MADFNIKRTLRCCLILMTCAWLTASCIHPQVKFQRAYHLDPTMDFNKQPRLPGAVLQNEARLGVEKAITGPSSGLGASCPTCGY